MLSRREAIKVAATCAAMPIILKADGSVDKESAVGKYELGKTKDGSFIVKSDKEDVRFRVGTSALLLRPKTEVSFKTDGVGIKTLQLITGGVMGVFAPGSKTIETKTFSAGIRGTGIYLEEHECDKDYICLCYGKADYVAKNGKKFASIITTHHDNPLMITGKKDGDVGFAPFQANNHNDDELRTLEKMCQRTVPFDK